MSMTLFKYNPTGSETQLGTGLAEPVEGADRITWVERYQTPGEFKIEAKLSSNLLETLPIDSLISHQDTLEIMMVEDHHILEEKDKEARITISGRSFDAFLEHRVVGQNLVRQSNFPLAFYTFGTGQAWTQAAVLVKQHIETDQTYVPDDGLDNVSVLNTVYGVVGSPEPQKRTLPRKSVHENLMDLLKINDCGIKVIRPGNFPFTVNQSATDINLVIHYGTDKTDDFMFSAELGDIESSEYLWTTRGRKTAVVATSRYVERYTANGQKFNRRYINLDVSDLDNNMSEEPSPEQAAAIGVDAYQRARDFRAAQQRTVRMTNVKIANDSRFIFRRDYNIGDRVLVAGNYGATEIMRVVEYAEFQDENGRTGSPTLSVFES